MDILFILDYAYRPCALKVDFSDSKSYKMND